MYPHERSLVKRLEGKPFALIGVNSDDSRETVKSARVSENLSWRSFWNGGSTDGPISRAWGVRGWPSIWVIDAKGIVRKKFEGAPQGDILDQAVDQLLREMGAGG
jgi:hypothetical protein